ncbi:MAG TPA: polysaccharide biosynthesis/export family protein [Geminicoccaceae bacterium]|nr:polysaccharide biosynthesis/export family protein [Geminicoccaceae bacterium]
MIRHRQITVLLGLALSVALIGGCSSSRPAPVEAAAAAAATGGGEPIEDISSYRLGPGDALRVTVFRHEDLSGEFTLDGDGYFAMPLVGEVLGGGRTARQLESDIEEALKSGGYLVEPQVSIEVLNYRPFYIIGEVNNPGSFEYVNGMTVINAVALAGGFTYRADQDDIIISRGGSSGTQIQAAPDTEVLPGDIIEVTERFF